MGGNVNLQRNVDSGGEVRALRSDRTPIAFAQREAMGGQLRNESSISPIVDIMLQESLGLAPCAHHSEPGSMSRHQRPSVQQETFRALAEDKKRTAARYRTIAPDLHAARAGRGFYGSR